MGRTHMFGFTVFAAFKPIATVPMLSRGAIVAVNFGVMMLLATTLGLDAFGELAVQWGIALVIAPVVSLGGPLLLLRAMTGGGGVGLGGVLLHVIIWPAAITLVGVVICATIWPTLPWELIFLNAFCINALSCSASVTRAFGSVNASMVLRDSGPQIALGLGAAFTGSVFLFSAYWVGAFFCAACVWSWRRPERAKIINDTHVTPRVSPALWGTSVLGVGLSQIDIIIGGTLLSPAQIGLYVVLRRVANLVALPVSVATWVSASAVSKSHASGDVNALQIASITGSRVALLPGILLFLLGVLAVPFLPADARAIFTVLLIGAVVQVVFASGFTVATLAGMAQYAVLSRGFSIVVYLAFALWVTGPVANALAYVGAISLGSLALWAAIRQRSAVDTSAFALRNMSGATWKTS